MSNEIEEIVESDPSPKHEDDSREYDKDGDTENGNNSEVNDEEMDSGAWKKNKSSTRVWCFPLRLKKVKNRRRKEDESEQRESQFDSDLPSSFLSHNQFKKSSFFRDFQAKFDVLEPIEKQCLLSFIIFPENTIVKKRHLLFWWIGEGLLEDPKNYEVSASAILCKFTQMNFIVQVKNSFIIQPHIRSLLTVLAIEANSYGSNTCSWYDDRGYLINSKPPLLQNDDLVKTLFNISMETLDFKLEWFAKLRNVKALYLGRWQNSAEHHHIEVVGTEFLKGFKSMKNLKSLSLEGISGIQELPDSISNLTSLRVLDLRACYNLEKLPKEIESLKKLTHLDISECYLLDYMPRELLSLSELQVLKGFVITDTKDRIFCSLDDLAGLKKLRKLSVSCGSFSLEALSAVLKFKQLVKLKIIWGGKVSKVKRNKNSEAKAEAYERRRSLKRQESAIREANQVSLEKLELQCLPHKSLPKWVNPENLPSLKKLYIIGGGIKNLRRAGEGSDKWRKVESLRLKYLNDLNVKWMDVKMLFPELQSLEMFQCPKVVLFPCDCNGIWLKPPPLPQTTV